MTEAVLEKPRRQGRQKKDAVSAPVAKSVQAPLFAPYLNNFTASACLMIMEVAAGRLIAAFVGFSIYTWTSVIGIVLGGLALGNYFGGILADRYQFEKVLPKLFLAAALTAGISPVFNQVIGNGLMYWHLPWIAKILMHVFAIFFVPSVLLGMIGPVVAKWALDQGGKTGQTVGGVYAWGTIGSVLGTFLAGFVLIPAMGTQYILFMTGGVLGAFGFFHLLRVPVAMRTSAVVLAFTVFMLGIHGSGIANPMTLRSNFLDEIQTIYAKESQYSYIRVETSQKVPELRVLKLDQLVHGVVDTRNPANLDHVEQYDYIKVYADLTQHLFGQANPLRTFTIGAGAYIMPRFIQKNWKNSVIEIVEIDPEVTRTAQKVLGLAKDHGFKIFHQDARNRVEDMMMAKHDGRFSVGFDIVYGDTFNHVSVPYHLTTVEFNEKIKALLSARGVYLMNIIDSLESGKFLGAIYGTLKKTFPNVRVYIAGNDNAQGSQRWRTFVFLNSSVPIEEASLQGIPYRELKESELARFAEASGHLILTDDYAPVDNLLADMVSQRGQALEGALVASKLMDESLHLVRAGKLEKAMANYKKIIQFDPQVAAGAFYNMGVIRAGQGRLEEALKLLEKALEVDSSFEAAREKIRQIGYKVQWRKEGAVS